MRLSMSGNVRIGRAWWDPRRAIALLGVFAILLQAILCAWHHHAHPPIWRGASAAVAAAAATGDQIPASADEDCQFCFALSHHSAAPVEFFATPLPDQSPLPAAPAMAVTHPVASYLLFRSRAPPRA